nr:hypothetical protein [uncultured Desulfobulbus sp.]
MRTRFDNFKELVEETIRESKAPFTFFSTDDQYLFKSTYIPEKALQCIADDPTNVSFRLGMSDRLKNERALPEKIKVNRLDYDENEYQGTLLTWDARDPNATKLWEYSFNVDFQIYQSDALLDFLSPILYHIPTTLEYAGLRVARKNDRFRKLIGTTEKTIIGMQLNLAQTLVNNVAANFSLDALSSLYTQGYRLTIPKEQLTDIDWLFMPQTLFFYKKSQPDTIFEFKDIA